MCKAFRNRRPVPFTTAVALWVSPENQTRSEPTGYVSVFCKKKKKKSEFHVNLKMLRSNSFLSSEGFILVWRAMSQQCCSWKQWMRRQVSRQLCAEASVEPCLWSTPWGTPALFSLLPHITPWFSGSGLLEAKIEQIICLYSPIVCLHVSTAQRSQAPTLSILLWITLVLQIYHFCLTKEF